MFPSSSFPSSFPSSLEYSLNSSEWIPLVTLPLESSKIISLICNVFVFTLFLRGRKIICSIVGSVRVSSGGIIGSIRVSSGGIIGEWRVSSGGIIGEWWVSSGGITGEWVSLIDDSKVDFFSCVFFVLESTRFPLHLLQKHWTLSYVSLL